MVKQGASPPERIRWWLSNYWSRALLTAAVSAAALGAGAVGLAVRVPRHIPDVALGAAPAYRAEVGGLCFAIAYVAIQAIGLAVRGRGFVRFGPRGVEPGRILKKRRASRRDDR